jgi:hypothetical protein
VLSFDLKDCCGGNLPQHHALADGGSSGVNTITSYAISTVNHV